MTTTFQPTSLRIINGLGDPSPVPAAHGHGAHAGDLHLDPRTFARALDCVHCGLCLPACPTYTQNGLEADSPRGRIHLMKGLATGKIEATASVLEHLDLCLDCRACETACPSGVQYHELIEGTRAAFTEHPPKATKPRTMIDEIIDAMFFKVFPFPLRLKIALLPARILQKIGLWKPLTKLTKLLPLRVQKMQQMLPEQGPLWEKALAEFHPANKANCPDGKPRATIALLAGCVGSVLYQHVNRQTIDLLTHAGCDVIVPAAQTCCGAIHHHAGHAHEGENFARMNVEAFAGKGTKGLRDKGIKGESQGVSSSPLSPSVPPSLSPFPSPDYIITNIAGCGAQLKDYAHFLRDDPRFAARGKDFASRVKDVSEVLVKFAPPPPPHEVNATATYHDACHLAHAQKVTDPPRKMLSWIKGLKLIPLTESDMCCGAAGTYNLSQPDMAMQLGERKLAHIQKTGAKVCITGNVGCAMQIQSEAQRLGLELRVMHPVSVLHEAVFGRNA